MKRVGKGGRAGQRSAKAAAMVSVDEYAAMASASVEQVREWVATGEVYGKGEMVAPPAHGSPPPGYLRVRDFAAINLVSPAWVYYLASKRRVASCRVPTGGGYYRTFIPPWETMDGEGRDGEDRADDKQRYG